MYSLDEILKNKIPGLYYGNRIILPCKLHFLKVIVEKDVITDFSNSSRGIQVIENEQYTDVYFLEYKVLRDVISKYEAIKMVVVEKGNSIFNYENHKKLNLYFEDNHKLVIEETDSDILFIE